MSKIKMKNTLFTLVLMAPSIFAQQHPQGVVRVNGTSGCNNVVGTTDIPQLSLLRSARLGDSIVWRWDNMPNLSPICPQATVVTIFSIHLMSPAIIPGSTCPIYVLPLDMVLGLANMCSVSSGNAWIQLPIYQPLVGFSFYAQTAGWATIQSNQYWFSTNAIQITILQ